MSEPNPPTPTAEIVRYTRPEPPAIGLTGALDRITGLGLGAAGILVRASVDAIERFVPTEPSAGRTTASGPVGDAVRLVPGAMLGVGFAMRRGLLATSGALERSAVRALDAVGRPRIVHAPVALAERYLDDLNQRAAAEQEHNQALVIEFATRLAPALAEAIMRRIDIGEIVAQLPLEDIIEQVDVNALIDRVDIEHLIGRVAIDKLIEQVDVDALIGRVDVDAIVARVDVDAIIDRVDVERIIERVDVDAIIDRVDVERIIERVDIDKIMERVDIAKIMDEVDIAGIVRDSTGTVTGDMVDAGRVTAMRFDRYTARLVDRMLLRRKPRRLTIEGYDTGTEEGRDD